MEITEQKLREILVGAGYVDEQDFELAKKEAGERKEAIEDVLSEKEIISRGDLAKAVAQEMGYQYIDLAKEKIEQDILEIIPELMAKSKGVVAFGQNQDGIKVGMLNPDDMETRYLIEKRTGQNVIPYLIIKQDLEAALGKYQPALKDEFKKILKVVKNKSLSQEKRDEATIKMVNALLEYGEQNKASDIHIEPYRKKVVIRFRIDGILHEVLELPKDLHELIVMRIKILSQMRTDEHRAAQDGKFRFKTEQESIDVRVSIVPVTEGENVVMRLLSAKSRQFGLKDLGLSDENLKKVQKAIKKPHGMILVTGPTGCGKTTTLYAVLKILNKPEVHIETIEDPVEYDIEGVRQIQVNPKTNLTFAKGLRAIVRQDPDIIMVGEIRDQETAGIAVNSALTGHLVLSTLHTNDAATTLPRLLDMDVENFLAASTVNIAIAQRLVRQICEKCRVSYQVTEEEKSLIESQSGIAAIFKKKGCLNLSKMVFFKGVGCKVCSNTGYTGRTGIFEVLEMAENIKELVLKNASSGEIMKQAIANGMTTMLEDGIEKVLQGLTTLQEVLRVTAE